METKIDGLDFLLRHKARTLRESESCGAYPKEMRKPKSERRTEFPVALPILEFQRMCAVRLFLFIPALPVPQKHPIAGTGP